MFESLVSIAEECSSRNVDFARVVKDWEIKNTGSSESQVIIKMKVMWNAMLACDESYDPSLKSRSGLSGGDGGIFESYASGNETICGDFISKVIAAALKTAESNACMKRIVASPTAGSCGVLPSVLVPLYREGKYSEEKIVDALFVAAGIGQVIANRASISGAEGGCQAEVGAASAMAAGALVYLKGGSASQSVNAAGWCLQNLLGLVCDPVAGLVEVPCVKRNVIGAVNACSCADMALSGMLPEIPADEVIDAMKRVGNVLPETLRETGLGGIAATPSAKAIKTKLGM